MSVRAVHNVLEHSNSRVSQRLVMLCLADMADDCGCCWPLVSTLEAKSQIPRRTLLRALAALEEKDEIRVFRRATSGRSSVYFLMPGVWMPLPVEHPYLVEARALSIPGAILAPPPCQSGTTLVPLLAPQRTVIEPSVEPTTSPVSPPPQLSLLPTEPPKEQRKPSARPMPDPWELGHGNTVDIAKRRYVDILTAEREFDAFKAHHQAKGSRFVNWEAAWNTWLINRERFQQERTR